MVNSVTSRILFNSDMRQEIQDAVMKVYDETDEVIPDKNATSDNEESDEA